MPDFADLARRLDGACGWDDLVLPPEKLAALREICAHARQRAGHGITVLLSGPSGTGKTMSAMVIARELGLDLYRVDLSQVVSKYIGETEKNLARLFERAENTGTILFFDEADALFGKRTEVKDSHDRFANLETSYVLQRLEQYRGLAFLSTLRHDLDSAFLRRLDFIVSLSAPEAPERHESS
jgi:SpoVK/Ycf46/Vps4 family AAA+-type ATPase